MKRTQIYLDEGLSEDLKMLADAEGRSAASIVREAVQTYVAAKRPDPASNPLLGLVGAGDGGPEDAAEEHDRYLYGSEDEG